MHWDCLSLVLKQKRTFGKWVCLPDGWLTELGFSLFTWFCCFVRKKWWNRNQVIQLSLQLCASLPAPLWAVTLIIWASVSSSENGDNSIIGLKWESNLRSRVENISYTESMLHMWLGRAARCTWAVCTLGTGVSCGCDLPRLCLALVVSHVERIWNTGVMFGFLRWSLSCRVGDPAFAVMEGL